MRRNMQFTGGGGMQEVYHRRKNQSITDYRRATGFEALIGHLYLSEEYERLTELVTIGLEAMEEKFDTERNEGAKNAGK